MLLSDRSVPNKAEEKKGVFKFNSFQSILHSSFVLNLTMPKSTSKCKSAKLLLISHLPDGQDFIRILSTPDAEEIIPAVFCPCELRYWKGERRLIWRTAYVLHGEMNVAVGPSKEHFEKKFLGEMERAAATAGITDAHEEHKDKDERFFALLLPHRFEKIPGQSQIPVDIFQGVLSGLHRNPEVQSLQYL